ncbi:MAG TPA: hypothetical protein DDX72_08060 [Ruminococcaceae bacterium]|nr:hypothetical protein [Oscillospiraceae bacterium]
MKKAIQYLLSVFGNKAVISDAQAASFPLYMNDLYELQDISLLGTEYVLVKHRKQPLLKTDSLLKERAQIHRFTHKQPVFIFYDLRLPRRNVLIQNDFCFIVPDKQIYLPLSLILLNERDAIATEYPQTFIKSTQIVFIYLLLRSVEEINAHRLADRIHISVTTANRALNELTDRGILQKEGNHTRVRYVMPDRISAWNIGKQYLFNPVSHVHHLTKRQVDLNSELLYKSHDSALYALSDQFDENANTVDCYACATGDYEKILTGKNAGIDRTALDNYINIQCLVYPPELFAEKGIVDIITLYAQYSDLPDERVQIALDEMIKEALNG